MLASQIAQRMENALILAESLWPAEITLPGIVRPIKCAGGSLVMTGPATQLGGVLTGYDVAFRVRKCLLPQMPKVGTRLTFNGADYRIERVSAPSNVAAWLIGADNPNKMNALDVAQVFLNYAAAQEALSGWALRLGQDSEEVNASQVIFDAHDEPLCGSASTSTIHLSIIVESHSQDSTEAAHAARVTTMRQTFFGANAGAERAMSLAVSTAMNNAQESIKIYGYGAEAGRPDHDQNRFRTPINIALLAAYI